MYFNFGNLLEENRIIVVVVVVAQCHHMSIMDFVVSLLVVAEV
jgi:hypothetical protein